MGHLINQIKDIIDNENKIKKDGLPKTYNEFNYVKSIGFSDKKLSELTKISENIVRKKRTTLLTQLHICKDMLTQKKNIQVNTEILE